MKKLKLTIIGTVAMLMAISLNFSHILNDYGVLDNKLHLDVLAQSNGGGSSNGGSGGSGGGTTAGSGSSSAGTSYLKELAWEECKLEQRIAGVAFYYRGVLIAMGEKFTVYGTQRACSFWIFSSCDQNLITPCQRID